MKREIKFRGLPTCKDKDELDYINFDRDGNFAVGFYEDGYIIGKVADASDDYISPEFWVAVDRNTVGQYTDLHDKNGREIYEGDIIVTHPKSRYEAPKSGVVQFGESCPSFRYKTEDGEEYNIWSSNANRTYEIIGNIWEDKQLLEGKHEQK